jgi:zinc transporter ZupT
MPSHSPDQVSLNAEIRSAAGRRSARLRALRLLVFAAVLELVVVLPGVDHLADSNSTIHFTQHGFIFAGGMLMGLALRDVQRASRR